MAVASLLYSILVCQRFHENAFLKSKSEIGIFLLG